MAKEGGAKIRYSPMVDCGSPSGEKGVNEGFKLFLVKWIGWCG